VARCERHADVDQVTVAAAADLTFAFRDVVVKFQQQTGNQVKLSFGSSGNFFSQIQNGAPFDLFFSADVSYAKKLDDAGLTEPGTLYQYAVGKIVLWAPSGSKLDLSSGLRVLRDPAIRKIAIANPRHAPGLSGRSVPMKTRIPRLRASRTIARKLSTIWAIGG
jgi:molybdate transport system substrate-binding protein